MYEQSNRMKINFVLIWTTYLPAPRLVFGAVYRHLGEMMKMMWDENLVINTVHVTDVAR